MMHKKLTGKCISVLLVILFVFLPLQIVHAAGTQYISELKLGYGETSEEAAKALKDEGYTIVTYKDEKGELITDKNENNYFDFNLGSASRFKKDLVVYMGYKTTDDKNAAITDISLMNMKGGYSFTEYDKLMDRYKESQIRPLVDRFLVTVNEYRTNYNSGEGLNRQKALFMHDVMNLFWDDDSGFRLGDLLLEKTKDEYTQEEYEKILPDDKSKVPDLTSILMQGQTDMTFMIEQLTTFASDTGNDLWLDRLVKLGPNGLTEQYTSNGKTPTDANNEMAREYEDTARIISSKWDDFRTELMAYAEKNPDDGIIDDEDDEPATPDEGEEKESADDTHQATASQADDDVPIDTAQEILDAAKGQMEAASAVVDDVANLRVAVIYDYLKKTSYGAGNLYDFFTQPLNAVSGDNISALYPVAAALSPGQRAGADFLTLFQLVQMGIGDADSFNQAKENTQNLLKGTDEISIYSGVNRELYNKGVAVTDDLMRADAQSSSEVFNDWAMGITGKTFAFAAASVVSAVPMVYSWKAAVKSFKPKDPVISETMKMMNNMQDGDAIYKSLAHKPTAQSLFLGYKLDLTITDTGNGMRVQAVNRKGHVIDEVFSYDYKIQTTDDLKTVYNKCVSKATDIANEGVKWERIMKTGTAVLFSVVFLAVSAYTVWNAYQDIKAYYNIEMTPVPKYIVDRKDITTTGEDGSTVVYRNEKAYYEVVRCNRNADAPMAKDSYDYGDLNGDNGKEWLAMYTVKNSALGGPVRADSLKVVIGTTDVPQGYEKAIHMFGQSAAANLTDSRYAYNDSLGGIYVYYMTDKPAQPATTGSVFTQNGVMPALGIGFVIGGAAGLLAVLLVRKKKEKQKRGDNIQ